MPDPFAWHPNATFPAQQQRDLHGSPYWAEVSPDGSWGTLSPDHDGDVDSGQAADTEAAKRAVADWESAHQGIA